MEFYKFEGPTSTIVSASPDNYLHDDELPNFSFLPLCANNLTAFDLACTKSRFSESRSVYASKVFIVFICNGIYQNEIYCWSYQRGCGQYSRSGGPFRISARGSHINTFMCIPGLKNSKQLLYIVSNYNAKYVGLSLPSPLNFAMTFALQCSRNI